MVKPDFNERSLSFDKSSASPVFENLVAEDCETFFHYIDWLGLAQDPNLMILSSTHHYYYDTDDLSGVNTLVNLKKLNKIKHLNNFLHTIFRLLPPGANFVGCFEEDEYPGGITAPLYQPARLFNGIINFLDSRTDRKLSGDEVKKLLESHGFRVLDMTEINGTTYFMAMNTRGSAA